METSVPKLNTKVFKKTDSSHILNINDQPVSTSRATFRRKGNTYVIKNTESNEDVNDIFHIIDDMYDDIQSKSFWSSIKAQIYKFINLFINIAIISLGAIIGSLSITGSVPYLVGIFGYIISGIKAIASLLNLEQRSISMKQNSVQLARIARAVKMLKTETMPVNEYLKKMDEFNTLIDQININMFGELTFTSLDVTNKKVDDIIKEDEPKETLDKPNDVVISMNNVI
jgi:hypothetical protein